MPSPLDLTLSSGFLLLLDCPAGTELGIDTYVFRSGPAFQGIKLLPAGLHLFYASAAESGCRSSQWLEVPAGGCVHVARWVPGEESFALVLSTHGAYPHASVPADGAARQHAHAALAMAMDASLGPYPLHHAPAWRALTSHLTAPLLARLQGSRQACGESAAAAAAAAVAATPSPQLQPCFTRLLGVGAGSQPAHRTAHAMDSSASLGAALASAGWAGLLGELQAAFVWCIAGQSYHALEHWKALVDCLLRAEEALLLAQGSSSSSWGEALGTVLPAQLTALQGEEGLGLAEGVLRKGVLALARTGRQLQGGEDSSSSLGLAVGRLLEAAVQCGVVEGGGEVQALAVRLGRGEAGGQAPAQQGQGLEGYATLQELLQHLELEGEGELPTIVELEGEQGTEQGS